MLNAGIVQGMRVVLGRERPQTSHLTIRVSMWTNSAHVLSNMRREKLLTAFLK